MGFMAQGGDGCISVTANIAPRLCGDMHDAWKKRDLDKVFEIQDRLMPLHKALFVETSPGAGEVRRRADRPVQRQAAPAAGRMHRRHQEAGARRHGPCGPDQLVTSSPWRRNRSWTAWWWPRTARRGTTTSSRRPSRPAGADRHRGEIAARRAQPIAESYVTEEGGEAWLVNADIPEYAAGNRFNHEPRRPRKLLLHRGQINKLIGAIQREGRTVVPLQVYFNERGRAKIEIALATASRRTTSASRSRIATGSASARGCSSHRLSRCSSPKNRP